MLNELRDLARSLSESGIGFARWHQNFVKCPGSAVACFIYLNERGDIEDISFPEADFDVTEIRKWEKANGCSFPAFNVPSLYKIMNDETTDKVSQLRKILKSGRMCAAEDLSHMLESCLINWDPRALSNIRLCLTRAISEIEGRIGCIPAEYSAIDALMQRAKRLDPDAFHQQLKSHLLQKIFQGTNPGILDLLFSKGKKFQIISDIRDWAAIGSKYPPNHHNVQRWMNERLNHYTSVHMKSGGPERDAYDGIADGCEKKLPKVRMPLLADVILRAMSSEYPCQERYGMEDAASFPIGDGIRQEMKGSLEWISDKSRNGKTWSDITRKVSSKELKKAHRTILLAYPTRKPEDAPELAGLMSGDQEDSGEDNGASFSAIAERVIDALRGISSHTDPTEIRIFVLAKMDRARTKVLVSRRYTAEHTIKSAELWQIGCRNVPPIKIKRFEGGTVVLKDCMVPFPAEVVWCANTAWVRKGSYAERVHGSSINDALSLLLEEGKEARDISLRMIGTILRNCATLLLEIGQENSRGDSVYKIDKRYEKQAFLLPSILGLLLHKIGIEKGGFMKSSAYLVGRLLSLADDLHYKYCRHVRKGSVPPQLVGNALMPTALETPEKALSVLSQRILPYWAWGKAFSDGDDVGLVKYFLKQIGEITNELKESGIHSTCSDADKAQMLLGYLARSDKSE